MVALVVVVQENLLKAQMVAIQYKLHLVVETVAVVAVALVLMLTLPLPKTQEVQPPHLVAAAAVAEHQVTQMHFVWVVKQFMAVAVAVVVTMEQ
jgi:hypothetical protein